MTKRTMTRREFGSKVITVSAAAAAASLAAPTVVGAAKPRGWRYLVLNDESPFALVEVARVKSTDRVRLSHFSLGGEVQAFVQALSTLEGLDEDATREFELRLLCIPPLNVSALWLVSDNESQLLPLCASCGLDPARLSGVPAFFKCMVRAAERRLDCELEWNDAK